MKSPPELWAEVSDPAALARHLGEFGEISIIRAEPERSVAWEGEHARGTVALEPAGWGTRVTLAVTAEGGAPPEPEPEPEPEAEPVAVAPEPPPEPAVVAPEPVPAPSGGLLTRLFGRRRRGVAPVVQAPVVAAEPPPEPEPEPVVVVEDEPPAPVADPHIEAVLTATLDTLGGAHHRPFSRG